VISPDPAVVALGGDVYRIDLRGEVQVDQRVAAFLTRAQMVGLLAANRRELTRESINAEDLA
jgi:hypothetical protein